VTFKLWSGYGGSGGTGSVLQSTFMSAADLTTANVSRTFTFANTTLVNGAYSVELTAGNLDAKTFKVKTGAFTLSDGGIGLSSALYNTDGVTDGTSNTTFTATEVAAVPEPSDLLLGGVPALLGFFALSRRSAARKAAAKAE
jgi:hypothetical protein